MTKRLGTFFADDRIVRGNCENPSCSETDALLFDHVSDDLLRCASCTRKHIAEVGQRTEVCDTCGATPAWRDPVTRKNEFFCQKHHDPSATFQNRWANAPRISIPLGVQDKAKCAAADYGTPCWGEIKWRGEYDKLLCNKHAGKQSSGPDWHQKRQ